MTPAATVVKKRRMVALNSNGNRVGQDHPHAKLTDADVDLVFALREGGMKLSAIASKFGVKKAAIWKILAGLRRNQIPERWIEVRVKGAPPPRPSAAAPRKPYRKKEPPPPVVNHAAVDLQTVINSCWR